MRELRWRRKREQQRLSLLNSLIAKQEKYSVRKWLVYEVQMSACSTFVKEFEIEDEQHFRQHTLFNLTSKLQEHVSH